MLEWLPFPSPGDLPDPENKPMSPVSPALQADILSAEPLGTPIAESGCCCLATKQSPTFCYPMDCMPGSCILHNLLEFAQTHSIESVMQYNHLILCCPLVLLPSIFHSMRVAIVLEFQIQHQSLQCMFRTDGL